MSTILNFSKRIWAWFAVIAIVWTSLLLVSLFSNLQEHRESVTSFAKAEADVLIVHMTAARSWNATHGGVYLESNEKTPPNPYLLGMVEERDVVTAQGRKLTLVNPAYMTRLINEYFNESNKRVAHITSLNPIRSENVADEWETRALQSFEMGAKERAEISEIDGKPYMRLMRPLVTQQACLHCHAYQGYKVGDIRGGITASVPFEKHNLYLQKLNVNDSIAYGVIWFLGLVGLSFGCSRLNRDAVELQHAEENIHILSSSVEQASEAIMITDKKGIIEYVNPSFVLLTGYTREEVIGMSPNILKSGSHDDSFYQAMWRGLSQGEAWQNRVVNKRKDGSCYPAMLTISPIKDDAGNITHFVGSQQDLRDYEHLEDQFHQAQKMEALGTLVGGIAHDFNNTLAGITGNIYLAKKTVEGDPAASRRLETIETLSYRAAGMIKQLLAFSRNDVKSMNPMTISSFLKEAIKIHEVSIPENIKLRYRVEESDMQVKGDINQLQQVIMNLINNARDAVKESIDPTITVSLERVEADAQFLHLHPEIDNAKAFALIRIADNGHGIKQADIEHVFEPFFSTKEVGEGTGLGLAMVYGVIQSHGGAISVESQLGEGAVFNVWFPLLQPDQMVMVTTPDEEVIEGKGETILIVDDESTVVETAKAVLESVGYNIITARNGAEAIETYQRRSDEIDLLLMDVVMPVKSGVDAAAEIRKTDPDVKIIFATGYDRSNTLNGKSHLKSEVVIAKPFSAGKVSQLIREMLD